MLMMRHIPVSDTERLPDEKRGWGGGSDRKKRYLRNAFVYFDVQSPEYMILLGSSRHVLRIGSIVQVYVFALPVTRACVRWGKSTVGRSMFT